MVYPYIVLADGTEIVHTQVFENFLYMVDKGRFFRE